MKILNEEGKEIEVLDLGIVEAGKEKDFLFYLYNNENAKVIDIKIEIKNPEVSILSSPETIEPKSKESFKIKWSPNLIVKKGLKEKVIIKAKELYS